LLATCTFKDFINNFVEADTKLNITIPSLPADPNLTNVIALSYGKSTSRSKVGILSKLPDSSIPPGA
jgi:hypothetical protein